MKKGQITFMSKALIFVAAIIVFAVVIFQFYNFITTTTEQKRSNRLQNSAINTLQYLINSKECLAYVDEDTVREGVVDYDKLINFSEEYRNIEPSCARRINFDYQVEIEMLPENFTLYGGLESGEITETILSEIDNKSTVFLLDESGSMNAGDIGVVPDFHGQEHSDTRMGCVQLFTKRFIEQISNESEAAIYAYHGGCDPEHYADLEKVGGNRQYFYNATDEITAGGGTAIGGPTWRLYEEYRKDPSDEDAIDTMVILTDGMENSCHDPGDIEGVSEMINEEDPDFPLHTIAFSPGADPDPMEAAANATNGTFKHAMDCKDLVGGGPKENVTVESEEYSFGVGNFSTEIIGTVSNGDDALILDDAVDEEITTSMPITVKIDKDRSRKAIIRLRAVQGTMETFASTLNRVCELAQENEEEIQTSLNLEFNYPVEYREQDSEICMIGDRKTCKKIDCEKNIIFDDIEVAGRYNILIDLDPEENEISVIS